MGPRIRIAVLTAALIAPGAVVGPASADEHPRVEVIAEGLNNPRGIDVSPDGTAYVAEAGTGGDDHCAEIDEGEEPSEICMGESASVTAIAADGTTSTFVPALPSFGIEGEFVGAADVAVGQDGELYVAMGLGGTSELRDGIAADWEPAAALGTIQAFDDGALTAVADLAQWEADNDPNAGSPSTEGPQGAPSNDSNPNGLLVTAEGELLAVDAGGNTVLEVDAGTGDIALRALFEDRMADAPPFLGLPPGTQIPMQAVPTNLTEGPAGGIVVGELTGFPFPVGGANVQQLNETQTPEVLETGFTNIMDVAYLDGELYVLELAHDGLLSGSMEGALVRVREDGTRIALLRDVLVAPGGLAAHDGMLYVTNHSVGAPGTGSVLRFDPSQAADPATQAACPPLVVPGTALSDVADSVHEEAITCVTWHGLFSGFADGTFRPSADITRGQFATTVTNLIAATGTELPEGQQGVFDDVDGTTHGEAINVLAAAGLVNGFGDGTYRPAAQLSRAQAVSILVSAYEFVTGETLAEGADAFDDDGAPHEANLTAAASMGWVLGTGERTFTPAANIRRGQMASGLARIASDLVDEGHLSLPE